MNKYYTYILKCSDNTLYTGWTTDIQNRLTNHNKGIGSKYTKSRLPVKLVYYEVFDNQRDAMQREWQIKQMKRSQKQGLIKKFICCL